MVSHVSSLSTSAIDLTLTPEFTDWSTVEGCRVIRSCTLKNGMSVCIFRYRDDFITETMINGRRYQDTVDVDMSPDEFERIAQKQILYLETDGKIGFMWSKKSELNDVTIDGDHWGVTIVNSTREKSPSNAPLNCAGHAVIIIEKIDEDGYQMWRSDALIGAIWKKQGQNQLERSLEHFLDGGLPTLLKVRWREISKDEMGRYYNAPRTQTWVRTKNLVQKLIDQLNKEAERSLRNEPIGFRNGKPMLFCAPGGTSEISCDHLYNCSKWARERVFLANIDVPKNISFFAPGDYPISYTNSASARVTLEANGFLAYAFVLTVSSVVSGGGLGVTLSFSLPIALFVNGVKNFLERSDQRRQFQRFADEINRGNT